MFFSWPKILPMVPPAGPILAHVEQQGAGAAGEVHHALQPLLGPGLRFLAVQRDDGGEDVGNLLRGVELARLLAGPGGELADQVFIGIAQRVDVRGELRQPFGDLLDDGAELGVPVGVGLAQLGGARLISENRPWKVLSKDSSRCI
jgi:hypothetical protein